MDTAEFWEGDFGNEYHARNRVDWRRRIRFWSEIMDMTGARSVYEWGCGPGWNLSAIKTACATKPFLGWDVRATGFDVNESALYQAGEAGLYVEGYETDGIFEMAFTAGALIHVAPEDLQRVMQGLIDRSSDYVLAVEYYNPTEKMIPYRGHDNKLWARPYGDLYEKMGLKMVATGGAGEGFDDCVFWLLRK